MYVRLVALAVFALAPFFAQAHEVYVLSPTQIAHDIATPPFNEAAVAWMDLSQFIFWAFLAILTVGIVFFGSITHAAEKFFAPFFARIRPYAAPIARITVALGFLAAAYFGASYGPELPLASTFGAYTDAVRLILVLIGIFMLIGSYVRIAAAAALVLFALAVYYHGVYMLTYTNYLGEILLLLILGAHHGAAPKEHRKPFGLLRIVEPWAKRFAPYSFFILRVCFGISLFYASFYAKILHNYLALQVASLPLAGHAHSLAYNLGFEPHFLVLGAAIVELVIALFFIFGIEIRFTALFLLFWLSLSLIYFGEVVWPHIILIGIPIAFICWGYDRYSLEGWLFKRGAREPVL